MGAAIKYCKRLAGRSLEWSLNRTLGFMVREFNEEVSRRNAQRKKHGQWLTSEEAAVAEALGKIIVPSDEDTPGFDEVSVLGASAISSLDNLIKNCGDRQYCYSRGLLSFDIWAWREHGRKFVDLSTERQTNLFRAAQEVHENLKRRPSRIAKVWRRFGAPFAEVRNGTLYAAGLYPVIRNDCVQIFYTSQVSWVWLGYDGPPMEKGYSNLIQPTPRPESGAARHHFKEPR
jgi:hypothetical protein